MSSSPIPWRPATSLAAWTTWTTSPSTGLASTLPPASSTCSLLGTPFSKKTRTYSGLSGAAVRSGGREARQRRAEQVAPLEPGVELERRQEELLDQLAAQVDRLVDERAERPRLLGGTVEIGLALADVGRERHDLPALLLEHPG